MKNMLSKVGTKVSNIGGKTFLKIDKHSPEILMVSGIVSLLGAGVLASRATLKSEAIVDEHNERMDKINLVANNPEEYDNYSEEDMKKDKLILFSQTGIELAKIYAPALTMAAFGTVCILSGQKIMRKRNVALMAAYKLVEGSFEEYRGRVIEELGEEKDKQFKYGLTSEKYKEKITDENGKTKTLTHEVSVADGEYSMYARFYDSSCREWTKNAEYNMMFLRSQQSMFNDMLKTRGHVFLNEVYDALGLERTKAGAVVGWMISKDGDNFVDFGIYETSIRNQAFVNGYEPTVLLDFNVDGVIYDKI